VGVMVLGFDPRGRGHMGGGGLRGALRVLADGCDISLVFWFDTPL
jgi:hypothetical protein